jgi:hypothetical protein
MKAGFYCFSYLNTTGLWDVALCSLMEVDSFHKTIDAITKKVLIFVLAAVRT